jgi:hypothetical protein
LGAINIMSNGTTPANAQSPASILLARVAECLDQGKAGEALEAIGRSRQSAPQVDNARAVCLMRLDRADEAVKVLRNLLFPRDSINVDEGSPLAFRLNFATGLLLTSNVAGAKEFLAAIPRGQDSPMLVKLRESIRQWKANLPVHWKLLTLLGIYPGKPVVLDFPPGELWLPEAR